MVMEESNARRGYGIWGGIALPTDEAMLAEIPGRAEDPECDWYLDILFLVFLVCGSLIGRQ